MAAFKDDHAMRTGQLLIELAHFEVIEILGAGGAKHDEPKITAAMSGRKSRATCDDPGDLIGIERYFHGDARAARKPSGVNALGINGETLADVGPHGLR